MAKKTYQLTPEQQEKAKQLPEILRAKGYEVKVDHCICDLCPDCDGSGSFWLDECPTCGGSGIVAYDPDCSIHGDDIYEDEDVSIQR